VEPERRDGVAQAETRPEASERPARGWRRIPLWGRVAIVAVTILVLLVLAFDLGTASPKVCSSCHEMKPRAESWSQSAHSAVDCVECHQEPTAWYALPKRVADRARLFARDVTAHLSGDFEDPVDASVSGTEPVSDDVCLQCHDPNRKATSGFRILIDHPEHAKRNGSCVSCHVRTAHPLETRGRAMSLMTQCYTCHGTPEYPEAAAECGTCHPEGYDLFPSSHEEPTWANGHGDVYESDPKQCVMCHEQTFCDDCHGLPMPHPDDWVRGPNGHGTLAESEREVCEPCHDTGPDLCTMCHHTSYDPTQGTWIDQHPIEVREDGAAYCMECHSGPYCSYCHTALVEDEVP